MNTILTKKLSEIIVRVYTVSDLSNLLLVNEECIRKWIKNKELDSLYTGSKKTGYLIFEDHLQIFLDKHEKYRKRYDTVLAANKTVGVVNIKETSIKDFVLEYLYDKIPYGCFRKVSDALDQTSGGKVNFGIFDSGLYSYITFEDRAIIWHAIIYGYCKNREK